LIVSRATPILTCARYPPGTFDTHLSALSADAIALVEIGPMIVFSPGTVLRCGLKREKSCSSQVCDGCVVFLISPCAWGSGIRRRLNIKLVDSRGDPRAIGMIVRAHKHQ
jgi:hypothetical protein